MMRTAVSIIRTAVLALGRSPLAARAALPRVGVGVHEASTGLAELKAVVFPIRMMS
jgi:hypothetical protein